jgi:hypothetical protein
VVQVEVSVVEAASAVAEDLVADTVEVSAQAVV